jgi:hypothetical protein
MSAYARRIAVLSPASSGGWGLYPIPGAPGDRGAAVTATRDTTPRRRADTRPTPLTREEAEGRASTGG